MTTVLMFVFQGSRDNMSVVLICFPGAPKVSPEAVKKEADLDKYLEGRVEGTFDKHLIRLSFFSSNVIRGRCMSKSLCENVGLGAGFVPSNWR